MLPWAVGLNQETHHASSGQLGGNVAEVSIFNTDSSMFPTQRYPPLVQMLVGFPSMVHIKVK